MDKLEGKFETTRKEFNDRMDKMDEKIDKLSEKLDSSIKEIRDLVGRRRKIFAIRNDTDKF